MSRFVFLKRFLWLLFEEGSEGQEWKQWVQSGAGQEMTMGCTQGSSQEGGGTGGVCGLFQGVTDRTC